MSKRLHSVKRALWRAFFCATPVCAQQGALASDRPYLAATSAVVDVDDDRVAALESWIEWSRRVREFRFEPEYNFDPRNAVRVEMGINQDRRFDPALRGRSVDVEWKHLVTDLARAGWGSGLIVGIDRVLGKGVLGKGNAEAAESDWSVGASGLLSLRPTSDTLAHFNAGLVKPSGDSARLRWAVAVVHEIVRRTSVFVEVGAVAREERLVHGGVRRWIKRERFAVDLTVGRRRSEPAASTFVTLGIALQDLGF